jgi:putative phosphoesterase
MQSSADPTTPSRRFRLGRLPGKPAPSRQTKRGGSRQQDLSVIGVISDTHGLVRPEALAALQGSRFIIHAGDLGSEAVFRALEQIAPVYAVRGNNDHGDWAEQIPTTRVVTIGQLALYVIHDLKELNLEPAAEGFHAVIAGHSHRSLVERRNGVLFLNPGSAGPRRFRLPVTIARLHVRETELEAKVLDLAAWGSR